MKRTGIWMLMLVLVLSLSACAGEKPPAVQEAAVTEAPEDNAAEATWPGELMGNLPVPECQVTGVTAYDANSMSGELVIVQVAGMSKETAEKYVAQLTELGYVDGVSSTNGDKMIFSGTASDKAAVNFDYDAKTQGGNISYKPAP